MFIWLVNAKNLLDHAEVRLVINVPRYATRTDAIRSSRQLASASRRISLPEGSRFCRKLTFAVDQKYWGRSPCVVSKRSPARLWAYEGKIYSKGLTNYGKYLGRKRKESADVTEVNNQLDT